MNDTLSDPIPVKFTPEQDAALQEIADYTGVEKSKLVRLAAGTGLKELRERFGIMSKRKAPKPNSNAA